jgi:hypothetical protein
VSGLGYIVYDLISDNYGRTFNAAYIISIIAGTVMGEILFGRFVVGQAH